jgi:uncharacterized protein YegP (UPF0339 family)
MDDPEIFEDQQGGFRWRLVATNGNIIAGSGEGYASRSNCVRAVATVKRVASAAQVRDEAAA